MGKTWKKRDGHGNNNGKKTNKSKPYNEYRDFEGNTQSNHRSGRKEKEQRRNFENNFPDLNIEF